MGVSLRRFLGWEPESRVVPDGDGWLLVREPEFDKEQYELMVALHEHDSALDEYGIPIEESMSPLADPDNPAGTHFYVARPFRNWARQAQHDAESDPKWQGENSTPARQWHVERVER